MRSNCIKVDLCLYYSIQKKFASIKIYIFNEKNLHFSQKNPFPSKKKVFECKNIVETQKNAFKQCFSLIENVFFDRSKGF